MPGTDSYQEWNEYINSNEGLKRSWNYLFESTNDKNKHKIYTILGGKYLEGYTELQQKKEELEADEENLEQKQMWLKADEENLKSLKEWLEFERTSLEYKISQEIVDLKEALEEEMKSLEEEEVKLKRKEENLHGDYVEIEDRKNDLETRKNALMTKEHEIEAQMKKAIEEYIFYLFYNTITKKPNIDFGCHKVSTPSLNGLVEVNRFNNPDAVNIAKIIKEIKGLTKTVPNFIEKFKRIGDAIKEFANNQKPPPERQNWY